MTDTTKKIKEVAEATKEKIVETTKKVTDTIGVVQQEAKKIVKQVHDKFSHEGEKVLKFDDMLMKLKVPELLEKLKKNEIIEQGITFRKALYDKIGVVAREEFDKISNKVSELSKKVTNLTKKLNELTKYIKKSDDEKQEKSE